MFHALLDDADGQSQKAVDGTHPRSIPTSEVIVESEDVHALTTQSAQGHGTHGNQRLPLASAHLHDLALVQADATEDLHVKGAQPDFPPSDLPHEGKDVDQQLVRGRASASPVLESLRLFPKVCLARALQFRLKRVHSV